MIDTAYQEFYADILPQKSQGVFMFMDAIFKDLTIKEKVYIRKFSFFPMRFWLGKRLLYVIGISTQLYWPYTNMTKGCFLRINASKVRLNSKVDNASRCFTPTYILKGAVNWPSTITITLDI